jgi:hypothetical protein
MRQNIFKMALLAAAFNYILVNVSEAQALSAKELIENAGTYDGKTVEYKGEVIGDVMRRGQNCWLNISDGQNVLGVWAKRADADLVGYAGSYKIRGDLLGVKGVFNRICKMHGGDLDIHALEVSKIESGFAVPEKISTRRLTSIIIIFGALVLIWILMRLRIK